MILLFLCLAISLGERLRNVEHSVLENATNSYLVGRHSTSILTDAAVKKNHLHEHSVGFPSRTTTDTSLEPTGPALLQPETLTCSDGVLNLPRGRYRIDPDQRKGQSVHYFKGCKNLTSHGTTLELFAPLVFDSPHLEFQGQLAIVAKDGMTCLTGCYMKQFSIEAIFERMRPFLPDDGDDVNNEVSDDEWEDDYSLLEIPQGWQKDFKYLVGGAIDSFQLLTSGTLSIRNCSRSRGSGGAIRVDSDFQQLGGAVVIQNCTAKEHGGAISAGGHFSQRRGTLLIEDCAAFGERGGAIASSNFTQEGGLLRIQRCRLWSVRGGGIIFDREFFQQRGLIAIRNCSATVEARYHHHRTVQGVRGHGGAISSSHESLHRRESSAVLRQSGGTLVIQNCSAEHKGGAIRSSDLIQLDGALMIRSCSAMGGGAIEAYHLRIRNGTLSVDDSSAEFGGAILTEFLRLEGRGGLQIERCRATKNGGGGVAVNQEFFQLDGFISIHDCGAGDHGGAILSKGIYKQSGGSMRIGSCSARLNGGGLYAKSALYQDGDLLFRNCSARRGGAIYSSSKGRQRGLWQSEAARAVFENCSARTDGGALAVHFPGKLSLNGRTNFVNCSALDGRGGGLYVRGNPQLIASELFFQGCTASSEGAAVYSEGLTTLRNVTLNHCESGVSGALTVYGDLNVSNLKVSDAQELKGQSILSGGAARVHSLICSGVGRELCTVGAAKGSAVMDLVCPTGTERRQESGNETVGCNSCVSGHVRLVDAINPQCQRCPKQSIECLPAKLTMPPGMTVDPNNFSIELYCPNPVACPGGSLLASQSATNLSLEETYSAMSIFFYTAKDSFLFAFAAASSLSASKDKKRSAIFLNQLMAFATVANIVVTGVMQTRLFAEFHADTRRILTSAGLLANLAQAQGDGTASKD
eukprot:s3200_g3.t1